MKTKKIKTRKILGWCGSVLAGLLIGLLLNTAISWPLFPLIYRIDVLFICTAGMTGIILAMLSITLPWTAPVSVAYFGSAAFYLFVFLPFPGSAILPLIPVCASILILCYYFRYRFAIADFLHVSA